MNDNHRFRLILDRAGLVVWDYKLDRQHYYCGPYESSKYNEAVEYVRRLNSIQLVV